MEVISIGFGNFVNKNRVIAVMNPASAPLKRLKDQLKESGKLIDATQGRKTRSIIITDSGHMILCGLSTATIAERMEE